MRADPADEGLIEAPETFGGGRGLLFVVVIVFLATTIGTGVLDTLFPRKMPTLIGDEKTRDDEMRSNATLLDGSLARLIEDDLRVQSRVRRVLTEPYALFLYRVLREAKDVLVGEDGWLFLHSRARPPSLSAPSVAARAANQLAALERLLHAYGVRLVVAPIPRKAVVLQDMLPRGVDPVREVEERLVEDLLALGIPTADLLTAFAGADPRELFHFGDSHWTADAEILAAEEIARVGGFRLAPELRATELRPVEGVALGLDLFRWIGAGVDGTTPFLQEYRRDKYDVYRKDDAGRVRRRNPEEMGRIAIAGTSFTARRSLPAFLAHCSGESVWNAAKPGEGPMKPLREFLGTLEGKPWPEILVLEFPVHLILGTRGMKTIAGIFSDWAPPEWTSILGDEDWDRKAQKKAAGRRYKRVALLSAGKLGHTGDGSVSVRLTGKLRTERIDVLVENGAIKLDFPWAKGQDELVVPLMTQAPTSGSVTISVRSSKAASLKLASAEVVVALRPEPLAQGTIAAPAKSQKQRWTQEVTFPEGSVVPEQGALHLGLAPRRIKGRLELELELAGRAEPLSYVFRTVAPGGQIVIGLDGVAGQHLRSARVIGAGPPPPVGLVAADLRAPFD